MNIRTSVTRDFLLTLLIISVGVAVAIVTKHPASPNQSAKYVPKSNIAASTPEAKTVDGQTPIESRPANDGFATIILASNMVKIAPEQWENKIRIDDDSLFDRYRNLLFFEGSPVYDPEGKRIGIVENGKIVSQVVEADEKKASF